MWSQGSVRRCERLKRFCTAVYICLFGRVHLGGSCCTSSRKGTDARKMFRMCSGKHTGQGLLANFNHTNVRFECFAACLHGTLAPCPVTGRHSEPRGWKLKQTVSTESREAENETGRSPCSCKARLSSDANKGIRHTTWAVEP